ncbi:hypothetical protein KCP69_13965 [Salmonella enterica subsp. enterica]|nr:hypothetical protein KCP69_13965 [Salmonella enterica subsp. enterica]
MSSFSDSHRKNWRGDGSSAPDAVFRRGKIGWPAHRQWRAHVERPASLRHPPGLSAAWRGRRGNLLSGSDAAGAVSGRNRAGGCHRHNPRRKPQSTSPGTWRSYRVP